MLIGIDASRAFKSQKTGVEWYAYHLISNLAKIDPHNEYRLYTDKLGSEKIDLPKNFKVKVLNWPFNFFWTQARLSWEMLINSPELLFVPAHILPLYTKCFTLTTIHDVGFIYYPSYYDSKHLKSLDFGIKLAKRKKSRIITISEFSKKEIINNYGIKPEMISVIHLGVDYEKYHNSLSQPIDNDYIESVVGREPYIITISRIEKRKNILNLVAAFDRIKKTISDLKLIITGRPGKDSEKILTCIKDRQDIKYLGWTDEKQKINLLRAAKAFVFPSFYEGFGMPILEAQALGVPVVCSNTSSLPEVVGDSALLFDPNNIENMAKQIMLLLSDQSLRLSIIDKGSKNCQKFSWDKCAVETLKLIKIGKNS